MSEFEAAAEPGVTAAPSAGQLLREAREAAGIHIAALAVSLKVPVKKMEALEQDRFDLLPDAVFVRALAASVCRILKIDSREVLARLPQTSTPRLANHAVGINTPFRPAGGKVASPSLATQLSRPAVLVGLVLVLAALVLVLLPTLRDDVMALRNGVPSPASPDAAQVMPPELAASGDVPSAPVLAVEPSGPPASEPVAGTAAAVTPPAFSSTAAAPAAAASVPAAATILAAPAGADVLSFNARKESWVEVTDAKGAVVMRRLLTAGETATVTGVLPLSAVVGRADSTLVQVRGRPFDLTLMTRDNVARFEVK